MQYHAQRLAPALNPSAPSPQQDMRTLVLRFTGSGSEYLRIWIVNSLLTMVTLSLYYPFAKARRLRWFHANTQVEGQALGFHGSPWKMLRGHLLILAFAASYGLADHYAPQAKAVALVLFAALWPALWQSSLRFRLANTSWRGIRMRFTGRAVGAYQALLPALLPLVLVVATDMAMTAAKVRGTTTAPPSLLTTLAGLLAVPALAFLLLPWLSARAKRYQHSHYQWATQTTTLTVPTLEFYRLWFRTLMIGLPPILGMVLLVAIKLPAARSYGGQNTMVILMGLGALTYVAVVLACRSFLVARTQDLVWSGTHTESVQFICNLHASDLAWVQLKNLVFTALTLGAYWPFGQVNLARLRLQSLRLVVTGELTGAALELADTADTAAGDAAGDLLGIDIGL